jgi:hypothetical protein
MQLWRLSPDLQGILPNPRLPRISATLRERQQGRKEAHTAAKYPWRAKGAKTSFHRPHHRLAATAAERDDECCQRGNEPGESVNQQCEINVCHGFFLVFVRLNWRDVSEAKSRFQKHNGQGREAPRTRGEAAQAPARKQTALDVVRHRLKIVHGHAKGGRRGKPDDFRWRHGD